MKSGTNNSNGLQPPKANPRHGGGLWPVLVSLALFAGVLYCAWQIWENYSIYAETENNPETLVALKSEQTRLEGLLAISPCEARAKLEAPKQAIPSVQPGRQTPAVLPESGPQGASKTAFQYASSPDDIESACVFLVSLAGKNKISTGSGFFVAPGYIVTNRHVVGRPGGKILVTSKALGRPVAGRVVASGNGQDKDYAIVAVKMPETAKVSSLRFAPGVKKTQKVGAWGFPDIIGKNDPAYARLLKGADFTSVPELSYSEGVVSAVLDRNPRVIVHTAPISPGNSGGPLLNADGQVVGINTMITLDEDSYRQASIALDAHDLEDFLRLHGIEAQN